MEVSPHDQREPLSFMFLGDSFDYKTFHLAIRVLSFSKGVVLNEKRL